MLQQAGVRVKKARAEISGRADCKILPIFRLYREFGMPVRCRFREKATVRRSRDTRSRTMFFRAKMGDKNVGIHAGCSTHSSLRIVSVGFRVQRHFAVVSGHGSRSTAEERSGTCGPTGMKTRP